MTHDPGAGATPGPRKARDLGATLTQPKRVRKKVRGQTKAGVRDRLKELHSELNARVRTGHGYTVEKAVADWLAEGLPEACGQDG